MTITVRLPEKFAEKLGEIAKRDGKSPFELGQEFFGKYQSGNRDRSINARTMYKEKLIRQCLV